MIDKKILKKFNFFNHLNGCGKDDDDTANEPDKNETKEKPKDITLTLEIKDGKKILTGMADPDSDVFFYTDGNEIGKATADSDGEYYIYIYDLDIKEIPDGTYSIIAEGTKNGKISESSELSLYIEKSWEKIEWEGKNPWGVTNQDGTVYAEFTGGNKEDFFGSAVSLSGDGKTLAIVGSVIRMYTELENGAWGEITVEGTEENTLTGDVVSLSDNGSHLVVGGAGNVRIFERDSSDGILKEKKTINGDSSGGFGKSVSMSEDGLMIAVGAPYSSGGQVILYRRDTLSSTTWDETQITGDKGGEFGSSVSLSKYIPPEDSDEDPTDYTYHVAIGAPGYRGNISIYKLSDDSWELQKETISLPDGVAPEQGASISGTGSVITQSIELKCIPDLVLAWGTPLYYGEAGRLQVIVRDWQHLDAPWENTLDLEGDNFESIISQQFGEVVGPEEEVADIVRTDSTIFHGDQLGFSVSVSNSMIAVGAPYYGSNTVWSYYKDDYTPGRGLVKIFGKKAQVGSDIMVEDLENIGGLGYSLSLSKNGNRIAIGAPYHEWESDPDAIGFGEKVGESKGLAMIYELVIKAEVSEDEGT